MSLLPLLALRLNSTDAAVDTNSAPVHRLLNDFPTEIRMLVLLALKSVDTCAQLTKFCRLDKSLAKLCSESDDFWYELCSVAGYARRDRTTCFHDVRGDAAAASGMPWKFQFKKWCGLRMTNATLKKNVKKLLSADPTGAGSLPVYGPIGTWDISMVDDLSNLFQFKKSFDQSLNGWDTSNVRLLNYTFSQADAFNNGGQALEWNTSNVVSMYGTFSYARSFDQPLTWDVRSVRTMVVMFDNATSFNQPLNHWDTTNVAIMRAMFNGAKLFNQPLDKWDVSGVLDMSKMFLFAERFKQDLTGWDVSSVSDSASTFHGSSMQPSFAPGGLVGAWDVPPEYQ